MISKKNLATIFGALLLSTGLFAQDLTVVRLHSDPTAYVAFQAPNARELADVLADYGLPVSLARKAKHQGGNFYLPLREVLADSGSSRIWYRTEASSSVQELANEMGLSSDHLYQLNKLKTPQLSKGRYLLLGFVGAPVETVKPVAEHRVDTVQKPNTADTAATAAGPIPQPGRDSLGGLAAPEAPGFYAASFLARGKTKREGRMGLFKSVGGWYDGKFYALCNEVPVGTVVKIENPANGRHVFARVVSRLPGLAEDRNLVIRLSDAGRAALDVWGDNTEVKVAITD